MVIVILSIWFEGLVVHIWSPNHPDTRQRSHVDRVILLLLIEDKQGIEDKYVPIAETAVTAIELVGEPIGDSPDGELNS